MAISAVNVVDLVNPLLILKQRESEHTSRQTLDNWKVVRLTVHQVNEVHEFLPQITDNRRGWIMSSQYPVFSEGQILTTEDLEDLHQYAEQQDRRHVLIAATATVAATIAAILIALWCRLVGTKCCAEGVTVDGEPWTEVASLDASGPTDRHFVVDRATGTLTFGDGERGASLPAGGCIQASYRVGGGARGEVTPSRIDNDRERH